MRSQEEANQSLLPISQLMAVTAFGWTFFRGDMASDAEIVVGRLGPLLIAITPFWILGVSGPAVTTRALPQLRSAVDRVERVMTAAA